MGQSATSTLVESINKKQSSPKWMTTFADMMTLLLCFFVLLFSFSNTSPQRFTMVSQSFSKAFGVQVNSPVIPMGISDSAVDLGTGNSLLDTRQFEPQKDTFANDSQAPEDLQTIQRQLVKHFDAQGQHSDISMTLNSNLLTIRLSNQTAFASGSGFLQPRAESYIKQIAAFLLEFPGRIEITGHTDNQPVDNDLYNSNVELSVARAKAVADVMSPLMGERTITISGKGDAEPLQSNDSPEARALNRRVEILVFHGNAATASLSLSPLFQSPAPGQKEIP